MTQSLFFERIESIPANPIRTQLGLDRVNSAKVGGAIQSKEHSEFGRVDSIRSKIGAETPFNYFYSIFKVLYKLS